MIQVQAQLSGGAHPSVTLPASPGVGGDSGFPAAFAAAQPDLPAQAGPTEEPLPAEGLHETGGQPAAEAALPFFWHEAVAMIAPPPSIAAPPAAVPPDPDLGAAGLPPQPAATPIRDIPPPAQIHPLADAAPLASDGPGQAASQPALTGTGSAKLTVPAAAEETAPGQPAATLPGPARSDPRSADPAATADPRRMESPLAMVWQASAAASDAASSVRSGPDLPPPQAARLLQPATTPPAETAPVSPGPESLATEPGTILPQPPAEQPPAADSAAPPSRQSNDTAAPPRQPGIPAQPALDGPATPPPPGLAEAIADPRPDHPSDLQPGPIADLPETTGLAPLSLAQITATPAALASTSAAPPRPLAATLIELARDPAQGALELSLAPEELGRLRMSLVQEGDMVRVMLMAERPETLDLMRRHADQLSQEFRQAGFSGATLSFGQWGAGGSAQSQHQRPGETSAQRSEPAFPLTPQHPKSAVTAAGLDLRL